MKRFFKFFIRTALALFILVNVIVAFHAYKFTHFYENGSVTIKKPEKKRAGKRQRTYFSASMQSSKKIPLLPIQLFEQYTCKQKTG